MKAAQQQLDIFYPILPDIAWLERLVPLGIRTVQLRLKDKAPNEVRRQISESLKLCAKHRCQLIVNDYWQEAIELGADYVHLGQEDLAAADLTRIRETRIKLGISTHSREELAVALVAEPHYVALGPIYETKLKVMRWEPQGLGRIGEWKALIGSLPLVAIGGLTLERAPGAVGAGAQSIAVITDIVTNPDPETRLRQWLDWARSH